MKSYSHIRLDHSGAIRTLVLARASVRNAFNASTIAEITEALRDMRDLNDHRVLVIAAEGPMFCAGADFNWMGSLADASFDENIDDSRRLFDMFESLYNYPHPTIARVHGGAYGGGAGLICCCDIAIMAEHVQIAFSEVRLGLVPSAISPFVMRKIGEGRARELFLTGMGISAKRAFEIGLVNKVEPIEQLDVAVNSYIQQLLSCGPQAQTVAKHLLRDVSRRTLSDSKEFTAKIIAEQRVSDEGQEGMRAFLEERKPTFNIS